MENLKRQLLHKKRQMQNSLRESEWLMRCERIWETIWKSKSIAEHYFELQETMFKDGGGW